MTMYRSDHEAAVARIDALEADNTKLADENKRLREQLRSATPKPPKYTSLGTLVAITAFGALSFAMIAFTLVR
jgi:hypothetical protein